VGFLDKIFGRQKPSLIEEHGVIVHFQYGKENLDSLHQLESQLEKALAGKIVGDYDGHEIATDYSDGFLYLYGDNAERLFNEIKGTLESADFMAGAKVKLRFGPPKDGVKEVKFRLGES
jgi:archaeosine-15-forming tRNA-guanine transglycosylase